ncbi:MAG: protein kinase [Candidatus Aminicenantes bacterium]|nr:protein kinase [Candidatus Aminicenantes bacterium]
MTIQCPKCHSDNPDNTIYCGKCATPLKSAEKISITKTLITPAERLQKGSTIAGRYKIIEELGRGGMGVVYKAEDTKLKRTVALKFLPPELTHISEVRERFMREAQAAAALDHPNICTVHEFDEAEEKTFISMAYVEGQSLKKEMESGALELDEALKIATQVAEGLEEAHKKGVVHRDIKSANIMVTEKGQAKIMDFGLARVAGGTLVTKEGMTMGTIAYMSPEQARGEEVDHRTDIWSLGVVLYEMFSGQLPFKGEHDQAVVYSILKEKPGSITNLRPDMPMSIEQVVGKALEKNPDERYQQIDELLDDLRSISEGIVPEEIKARMRKAKLLRRKRTFLYAGIAGFVIIITVIALTLFTGRAEAIDSIAVLPLENLSGDPEQDPIAEGIHDALITDLAGLGLKRVIARSTVMRFKGKDTPPKKIAQDLNVKRLMTGTVVRSGDRVRVTAQLINPTTEAQEWAHNYERDLRDILSLQNEIVSAITREMKLQLTPQEETRLASARPVNPEAHVAYLRGRSLLNKLTPEGIERGLAYMQQAIDKEPTNPLPHAGLALGYCLIGHGPAPPPDVWERAREAALKAEELGGTLAETVAALGFIDLYFEWDWAGAERAFRRALELNPSLADAHRNYSWYLLLTGQMDEAVAEMKRAIEVDPLNPLWLSDLGWQYWSTGRYEEAMDAQRKALELDPNFNQGLAVLGCLYAEKGMYTEAIAAHQKLSALHPDWKWPLVGTYVLAGRRDEARKIMAELLRGEPKPTGAWDAWFLVEIYADLGEKDEAFRWLEAAFKERQSFLPWLRDNPGYAPLRDDPRFKDIVRRMKLPELK